jgi:hypothetical protein
MAYEAGWSLAADFRRLAFNVPPGFSSIAPRLARAVCGVWLAHQLAMIPLN